MYNDNNPQIKMKFLTLVKTTEQQSIHGGSPTYKFTADKSVTALTSRRLTGHRIFSLESVLLYISIRTTQRDILCLESWSRGKEEGYIATWGCEKTPASVRGLSVILKYRDNCAALRSMTWSFLLFLAKNKIVREPLWDDEKKSWWFEEV